MKIKVHMMIIDDLKCTMANNGIKCAMGFSNNKSSAYTENDVVVRTNCKFSELLLNFISF